MAALSRFFKPFPLTKSKLLGVAFVVSVVSTFCLEEPFRSSTRYVRVFVGSPPRSEQIGKIEPGPKGLEFLVVTEMHER